MTARLLMVASFGLAFSSAALAQSYTAPAGIPAATAPGGLDGRAAAHNIREARGRFGHPATGPAIKDGVSATGSLRGPAPRRGRSVD